MSVVVTSVICTVAVVGLLALAFWCGVKFEQRRRRKFDEFIEHAVERAETRVTAALAAAERSAPPELSGARTH